MDDLACEPGRLEGAVRITVAALLVAVVMLTFRMPFLAIGPYLVFILFQRDTLLTRAAAVLAVLVGVLASVLVILVVIAAWDTAWLRVSLLTTIFFGGYYFMRILAEPRIVLGALVVLALFSANFDTIPLPNTLLDQLGWIWAIFGLIFVSTFLTQWLLRAPSAREALRSQMRRILVAAEAACLEVAHGRRGGAAPLSGERADAAARLHILAGTKGLRPPQVARCKNLLQGSNDLLAAIAGAPPVNPCERTRLVNAARWLRELRFRVLRGGEAEPNALSDPPRTSGIPEALGTLAGGISGRSGLIEKEQGKRGASLVPPDWRTNPLHASFATRATLATMVCYMFMTLSDWGDIHTCMITCVVTAFSAAEERELKQHLRLIGAVIGGVLGMGAVVFLIPNFDSLPALLLMLAAGSMIAGWVALGSKRVSYAGWQIALAFYMTILQDPHPVTKFDVIWDRWVGIFIGIVAMRVAFAFPSLSELAGEPGDAVRS